MGASNFGRTNLPSGIVYAFAMGWDDEEHNAFNNEYDDTIECVCEKLWLNYYAKDKWLDKSRKIIGYVNVTLYNKDSKQWEDGNISVLVEHGYYEGARLDISVEDLINNFPPLNKSQKKLILREILRIEKVFKEATNVQYRKVWSFSNGEGVYEKVL